MPVSCDVLGWLDDAMGYSMWGKHRLFTFSMFAYRGVRMSFRFSSTWKSIMLLTNRNQMPDFIYS